MRIPPRRRPHERFIEPAAFVAAGGSGVYIVVDISRHSRRRKKERKKRHTRAECPR